MIKNDQTIYQIADLVEEGKKGYFPFRSRTSITRLIAQGKIPAHCVVLQKKNKQWFFVGEELVDWIQRRTLSEHTPEASEV